MFKRILLILSAFFFIHAAWAKSVTLIWGLNSAIIDVPDEIASLVLDNQEKIQQALLKNNVTAADLQDAVGEVRKAYDALISDGTLKTGTPYTTTVNGLNSFSELLGDVIPNSQGQQNVWANAWIGTLAPTPLHFGFGINAGATKLDLSALIQTADALGISMSGIPSTLVWPTVTADIRLGGIKLPFDIGFICMSLDSSMLNGKIDPVDFDFLAIGGDFRYALVKGLTGIKPRISLGAGYYFTRAGVEIKNDEADAGMKLKTHSIFLSAQASAKLLFFVPFIGTRVMFTNFNVDWSVRAKWESILASSSTDSGKLSDAASWGILPDEFSGGSSYGFFDNVRPIIYGGFSLDIAVIDLTFSVSYDFISKLPSGAFSFRFALN